METFQHKPQAGNRPFDSLIRQRQELYYFLIYEEDPVIRLSLKTHLHLLDDKILKMKEMHGYCFDEF
jgi:hypothetical protein